MKKLLIFIICICGGMASMQAQNTGNAAAIRKLQMAEFAIANLYVDSVDENKLVEEAIIRMLAQLDPHSTYNNAEEVKKMNEPLQGNQCPGQLRSPSLPALWPQCSAALHSTAG